MDVLLPDDDRDLRLARCLDKGAAPDGTFDALHDALRATWPGASVVDAATSERLWAGVARQMRTAPDRAPLRLVRTRPVRWLAAALVLLVVGTGVWQIQRGPDFVAASAAEIVTVDAPDGSTITLRPHSQLVRLGERAYKLEGEAFFAVARDEAHPFTVEADAVTVTVLGTRFDVSTWGGRAEVFVEEGRVEVRAAASALVLTAGDAAAATSNGVAPLLDATAEMALDWQRGEAVFDHADARRVADEVAHHFGLRVALPDAVARETVSGVLLLDDAPQALDRLGRLLGGRFEPDGDGGFRFAAP